MSTIGSLSGFSALISARIFFACFVRRARLALLWPGSVWAVAKKNFRPSSLSAKIAQATNRGPEVAFSLSSCLEPWSSRVSRSVL